MRLIEAWRFIETVQNILGNMNKVAPYQFSAFKPTVYPHAEGFPDAANCRLRNQPLSKIYPEKLVFAVAKVRKLKGLVAHGEVYISAEKVKKTLATKANTTPAALYRMLNAALKNIAYIQTPGKDSPTQNGTIDVYCHIKDSTQLRKLVIATTGKRKNQIISVCKTTKEETSEIRKRMKNPETKPQKNPSFN